MAPLFHSIILLVLSERKSFVVDKTLALLSAGAAVGFKLDSLLKLSDTRAANSKMTLMHYLCKVNYNRKMQPLVSDKGYIILKLSSFFLQVLASKASVLLNFHKDLESLESASKVCVCTFSVLYSLAVIG